MCRFFKVPSCSECPLDGLKQLMLLLKKYKSGNNILCNAIGTILQLLMQLEWLCRVYVGIMVMQCKLLFGGYHNLEHPINLGIPCAVLTMQY